MPLKLAPEDRRLVAVAASVFVLSIALAIFLVPAESAAHFASSYSTASEGAKAAYLLLSETGYRVQRWSRPPAELNDASHTLLILTDPQELPTQSEKDALGKFMSNGGVIVLAGTMAPVFVSETAPLQLPFSLGWQTFQAQAPSAQALNAPEIKLDTTASWSKAGQGIALYGDNSRYTVVQYTHGAGGVIWLASSSLLSNAGLRESGNLEFLLSTVGSKSRRVLWDEYYHGHREAAPTGVTHPQLAWLFGQLGFVAVAVLLTFSRHSLPQRAAQPESRLSPLEYVRALGQLYEHAGAANVAVDIVYERFRYAIGKRLGLRPSAANEELVPAVAGRWKIDAQDFRALIETCESARFFEDLSPKEALELVKRLHRYSMLFNLFPDAA